MQKINYLKVVEVPLDAILIFIASFLAYKIRFASFFINFRPIITHLPFDEYLKGILLIIPLTLIFLSLTGIYDLRERRKWIDEVSKIFIACSATATFVILFIFFKRELFASRFLIISTWFLVIFLLSLERLFLRFIRKFIYRQGKGLIGVVIIGKGSLSQYLIKVLNEKIDLGYKVIAQFDEFNEEVEKKLLPQIKNKKIDEVIQTDINLSSDQLRRLIDFCYIYHLNFKFTPDVLSEGFSRFGVETIEGYPILEIKKTPLEGWGKVIKRIFDFLVSVFLLIILSPLFLILALLIKLDSEGPILIKLPRVGEKGKIFPLFKFRSMVKNAHLFKKQLLVYNERKDGPLFKMKNDPRTTYFGRFLRKTSLDELPQLINVFLGQMSLVGPRPHEPQEVDKYKKHQRKLLTIKPGMTGLAQISGRSDLNFDEEVKLDTFYIENWSLKLDLIILFKTIPALMAKRKTI